MFGVSFTEVLLVALVTLVVVGPQKLPGMMRSLGEQVRKLRGFVTDMRAQTGIDDILRQEGFEGGIAELRSLLRGDLRGLAAAAMATRPAASTPGPDPYAAAAVDHTREYPPEGADAAGALPDDLVDPTTLGDLAG